jgi:hypothetical protein
MPTSRVAFMERLNAVLGSDGEQEAAAAAEPQPRTAVERLRDDLVARHGSALQRILVGDDAGDDEGRKTMLVVLDAPPASAAEEENRLAEDAGMRATVIDAASYEAMQRLARNGLIDMPGERMREIHPAPGAEQERAAAQAARARALMDQAVHKLKAAALLEGGGFAEEAQAPALEGARLAVGALAAGRGEPEPDDADAAAAFLLGNGPEEIPDGLPHEAIRILSGERADDGIVTPVRELVERISQIVADLPATAVVSA